jgi:murein DD-endopeptidase MepM/ murein hydrolase activator NlpD
LTARHLTFPVTSARIEGLVDTYAESRGDHPHEALDIIADMRTPVVAVEDGTIAKLFTSQGGGGLTIYQFDPAKEYCYYYAHLSGYAPGLKQGAEIHRGDQIGYVGMTGNARTPHLHFAIFKLGSEKLWWRGTALNPYPIFRPASAF